VPLTTIEPDSRTRREQTAPLEVALRLAHRPKGHREGAFTV